MSGVESLGDGDVRERLLPDRTRSASQNEDEEQDAFTHEELLHSIGSFSAVVWPVAVTMLLARCIKLFGFVHWIQHSSLTLGVMALLQFRVA